MLYLVFNPMLNLLSRKALFLFGVKLYLCFRFKNKKLFFLSDVVIQADKVMININVAD